MCAANSRAQHTSTHNDRASVLSVVVLACLLMIVLMLMLLLLHVAL